MLPALLLVVAGLGDRPHRATINAFAAGSIIEKEAIGPVVRIRPGSRFNGYLGHYRSNPHGFSLCGDQPVAQTESAQTGRMGGMAFGPGRGIGKPFGLDDGPVGNEHRGDSGMADLRKPLGDVPAQGCVELLAVNPDAGPFFSWILFRFAVRFTDQGSLWQHP